MLREDPTVWLGICKTLDFNWKMRHNSYMMIDKGITMKVEITREFLKSLTFRAFDETDYYGFAGVESPVPFIADTDELLVILDGDRCEVYDLEGLEPYAVCESVSSLPYTIDVGGEVSKSETFSD